MARSAPVAALKGACAAFAVALVAGAATCAVYYSRFESDASDPSARARRIAQSLSEAMNFTAFAAVVGIPLGIVAALVRHKRKAR